MRGVQGWFRSSGFHALTGSQADPCKQTPFVIGGRSSGHPACEEDLLDHGPVEVEPVGFLTLRPDSSSLTI